MSHPLLGFLECFKVLLMLGQTPAGSTGCFSPVPEKDKKQETRKLAFPLTEIQFFRLNRLSLIYYPQRGKQAPKLRTLWYLAC